MKALYGLSAGEYSDYHVMAMFEDEATAKAWEAAINADEEKRYMGARVESFMLVPAGMAPCKVTVHRYSVDLWDDGSIAAPRTWSSTGWAIEGGCTPPIRPRVRYVRAPTHNGLGGRLEVEGDNEQTVAKVAGEKIAMWRAGAWGGPSRNEILEHE